MGSLSRPLAPQGYVVEFCTLSTGTGTRDLNQRNGPGPERLLLPVARLVGGFNALAMKRFLGREAQACYLVTTLKPWSLWARLGTNLLPRFHAPWGQLVQCPMTPIPFLSPNPPLGCSGTGKPYTPAPAALMVSQPRGSESVQLQKHSAFPQSIQ